MVSVSQHQSVVRLKKKEVCLLTMSCALAWITDSTVPVMKTVPFLCVPFGSGNEILKIQETIFKTGIILCNLEPRVIRFFCQQLGTFSANNQSKEIPLSQTLSRRPTMTKKGSGLTYLKKKEWKLFNCASWLSPDVAIITSLFVS